MAFRFISDFLTTRKPLPLHRTYWRTVPIRRLTALLLAIFFLFGMVGCFVDLLDLGRKPFVPVIVWSVFSRFISVVWVIAYFRDMRWLIGAAILWIVGPRYPENPRSDDRLAFGSNGNLWHFDSER